MGLRDQLFGAAKSLRENLAEVITGSYEVKKLNDQQSWVVDKPNIIERIGGKKTEEYSVKKREPRPTDNRLLVPSYDTEIKRPNTDIAEPRQESFINKARAKIEDIFDGEDNNQASVITATQDEPEAVDTLQEEKVELPKNLGIKKENLIFQESTVGNGLPYLKTDSGSTSIGDIYKNIQIPEPKQKIKRVVISDPKEGVHVIESPEKVALANQIKAMTDEIAPEYTNYLLKLAQKEGLFDTQTDRPEEQNPGGGADRGIFQINSKAFPTVTDEMAKDLRFSILWAISLIESGDPKKGDSRYTGQEKWMADPAVRRSSIDIEY